MTIALRGEFYEMIGLDKNPDEIPYRKLQSFLVATMMLNIF
jgi:hypothetical protein